MTHRDTASLPLDITPRDAIRILGAGTAVGWIVLAGERGWVPGVISAAAVAGQASLMVFVAQFFVYNLIVAPLPLPSHAGLIPYFAATVAALWALAWYWGRINGNRFITVGLTGAVIQRRESAEAATGTKRASQAA